MRKIGNGNPSVCAENLLRLQRGEIPMDGLRGMPSDLIDRPSTEALPEARSTAKWLVETYEPRVSGVSVKAKI